MGHIETKKAGLTNYEKKIINNTFLSDSVGIFNYYT